jgi:hypothetical protein
MNRDNYDKELLRTLKSISANLSSIAANLNRISKTIERNVVKNLQITTNGIEGGYE